MHPDSTYNLSKREAMKTLFKKAFIPLSALGSTLMMLPARATDFTTSLATVGATAYGSAPEADIYKIIGEIVFAIMGLLGVVLLVLILYAGFLWMTAQGKEEQITRAKGMITNAVIGLVIIMAAYAIATFVFTAILNAAT
ncbi:hypothetical protein A2480_01055 [Candidatus Uhrbacteria bacterium RIFOXYC2_FULL_47_19]|uniref:DUF4134 domain-containing protein n=1 Tax=Candidatus Uhrbacteria bacterium RIFOXYC2_FULL_47_19 TaxID=1802424 RepID=A0A1F7WDM8_9BACT|nr:MAG: hypothetical protein A2480_01055 [Candidatus Uhrbacteria bacterium RIFOXYC2_FULL_47_19]